MLAAIRGRKSESPTRFSEISLRRYRKNARVKRSSAAAMSADEEAVVGHRTWSRSTLSLSGAGSGKSEQPPALSHLATVEAKMAGIESSLSTTTGTSRRRKETASVPVPVPVPAAAGPRDLLRELELLHTTLRERDQTILRLRSQIESAQQSDSDAERAARERERRALTERLSRLQTQTDTSRARAKNLRLALEKLEASENIDACIRQAELEYELEREELHILDLQAEQMTLRAKMEDAEGRGGGGGGPAAADRLSLTSCLPTSAETSLHLVTLQWEPRSPSFTVSTHLSGRGVLIEWAMDSTGLRKGDRVLELNGEHVFGHRKEALLALAAAAAAAPLRLLVVRCQPPSVAARRGAGRELAALREELALLAGRLEQKTLENKALHAEKERCVRDSEAYRTENVRLSHRIGYLDEQVQEMQADLDKIKGVTDESLRRTKKDVQVFTKGPHTATIPVNVAGRTDGPPATPTSAAESEPEPPAGHRPIYQNIRPKIKQKPRNILQRLQQLGAPPAAADSDTGSAFSVSTLDGKPRPPKKPARLSLQRATSVQSVRSADDTLCAGRRAAAAAASDTVQTWPSVERSLDQVRQRAAAADLASLRRLVRRHRPSAERL
ncbi:hypothetical protein FJT64_009185 [Amphibalanus amphitrite]|uniref:PDZ domain-containing protein n=1 Tax=Amphibalanus amphitrite TaxID=1232801 RepID=A0A6A4VH58_AMPAM|nr:uncharacterized protein LOC122387838 [Amphibalanus amphitrite]KAF0292903.1 hypothetical protein FJT64_009185 [Amphibalanus amphitrite]